MLAQPGQHYRYSSWGYTLLSAAIERTAELQSAPFRPLPEALARAFSAALQVPRHVVHLVALGPGLSRAALTAPLGLLEWRAIAPQAVQLHLPGARVVTISWP